MNVPQGEPWTPSHELLAAFADGELDRHPQRELLRRQIETWLAAHPEAAAALEAQLELERLMAATVAAEPSPRAWHRVWRRLHGSPRRRWGRWTAALCLTGAAVASAAAVIVALLVEHTAPQPPAEIPLVKAKATDNAASRAAAATVIHTGIVAGAVQRFRGFEVLEVATADEIEVVRVAGADTETLVAGRLPLVGPMVLIEPHEIDITPPANDSARTEVRKGMLWTPLPGDDDDDQDDAAAQNTAGTAAAFPISPLVICRELRR